MIADPGVDVRELDCEQTQKAGEQDEDGGHGRKGFWSNLCNCVVESAVDVILWLVKVSHLSYSTHDTFVAQIDG
jgi:hypothetical protein